MEIQKKIIRKLIIVVMFSSILSACKQSIVFEKTIDIDKQGWHKDSIIDIYYQPVDTIQSYDLFFLVRNDNKYPYSNLFLIASIENDNQKFTDTLEYEMADASGNWLGSGFGDLKESKLIFKKNYRFSDTLPVHLRVEQASRKTGQTMGDEYCPELNIGIILKTYWLHNKHMLYMILHLKCWFTFRWMRNDDLFGANV